MKWIFGFLLCAVVVLPVRADIDGHGPDAWQVVGVAVDDVLNARMGPGTEYAVIDHFSAGERGLKQVTCVPLVPMARYMEMSEAERAALPQRWCLMRSADLVRAGWVAQRYLAEDGLEPVEEAGVAVDVDPVDEAVELVRRMYSEHLENLRSGSRSSVYRGERGRVFFFGDSADTQESPGADPLWNAQDFDGRLISVEPDPDTPMFRGLIKVQVRFENFGRVQQATVYLRHDTMRGDGAVRILQIVHEDGTGWPE